MGRRVLEVGVLFAALVPNAASAHGFGAAYNLPVPLGLYHWGAALTLLMSFLLAGLFWSRAPRAASPLTGLEISHHPVVRGCQRLTPGLRGLGLMILLLCIATGLWGSSDPTRNFSPIFFWVIFLLLFTYLVALIGDAWAWLNPFRTLSQLALRPMRIGENGLFRYPAWLGDWPALALYLGFIWFELFSHRTPQGLGLLLLGYAILNIVGVVLVGRRHWFGHCELFSVFFRLVALLSPIDYQAEGAERGLRLRWPLSGLIHRRAEHLSTVVFVLAMISTTAMDGLQATQWWVGLFWQDPAGIFRSLAGASPLQMMQTLMPVYIAWESFWLLVSPFVYLAAYLFALWLARCLTGQTRPLLELAKDFSFSLLPIALVYNITHYWTLITSHGLKIFSLVSDPFGWRWDLFGTAMKFRAPILPDMGTIWHSQVGLILFGHVLSVCVAHQIALRIWPSRTAALLSQLPLLILMVGFTVFGLWILAQPLTAILPR